MNLFPFSRVREGQEDFMGDVEEAAKNGGHLIAHVPTGIGKTAAALAPALECALENALTVFFLTPKHTQHTIAVDTLQKIHEKHGGRFSVADFVGKQWMCPHKTEDLSSGEFNEFCRSLKRNEKCAHYNKVRREKLSDEAKKVVEEILEKPLHNEKVVSLCTKNKLCPYEILIEAGKKADVIICDYYHIFSPSVRKAFLGKLGKEPGSSILIVDEAHNLPDRVRSLLTINLTDFTLDRASNEANVLGAANLEDDIEDIRSVLKSLGHGVKRGGERYVEKNDFTKSVEKETRLKIDELANAFEELGEEVLKIPNRNRSFAKTVGRFLKGWVGEDVGYARVLTKENSISLSYKCLDPSISTKDVFGGSHASILMSGTLTPLGMYADVLGFDQERTSAKSYESPFPEENRLTMIVPSVTTKYSKRSDLMYNRYARIIAETLRNVPGNAAVFYPSYDLMEKIAYRLKQENTGKRALMERQDMNAADRRKLHSQLSSTKDNGGSVLMGVMAGSLSEGVDYPERLLDAVVVVGLPLEKPDLTTNSLIEYYDFKFGRGWDYGYIYPAVNRALQAAGRCIRSETDRGAIVLLDERFRWNNYAKVLPKADYIVTEEPVKYLKKFFSK